MNSISIAKALRLTGATACLAFIWLVVLPWVATIQPIADHIRRMNDKDINVGAMYYTELNWQPPDGAAFR